MAAILRVKRRNDEEPLDALILSYKRRKTDDSCETEQTDHAPLKTVVKFAGTVKNQDENVVEHIVKTLRKDELEANFKQHPVNIIHKLREKTKQASMKNRYKVVSCSRSLDNSNAALQDKVMTVIDVEDSISCKENQSSTLEENENFVYDIYYAQTYDDLPHNNFVSVHSLDQELVCDQYRDKYSDNECESEDSNSESNYKNDYPDSEPYSNNSIDEEDMRQAVMNMGLDDEGSDLSSDDDFVYAINEDDVNRHGYKYARYKARVIKEFGEDDSDVSEYSDCISEPPDDNDEYVNDESDNN